MTSKSQIKASRQYYQRHKEQVQQTKKEYYEKIKEAKKKRQMELYWQKKKEQTTIKQPTYTAKDIQILLPLKQYTQLNKEKFKIWFNFITTFKELANDDFFNIEQVRTLTMFSERLVRDYDYTAKSEATRRAQEWKHLTEKEQKEFIAYLARKKTREQQQAERKEQELSAEAKEWEAEIARELEIDNHHKERGKIGCECWSCVLAKK